MAIRDETRMLLESMTRLFEDKSTKQVIDRAETGVFAADLWQAVAETGVPLAALPESAGGADAEWSDLYAVLRVAGRYSAPHPAGGNDAGRLGRRQCRAGTVGRADDRRAGARRRSADVWRATATAGACPARPAGCPTPRTRRRPS